MANDPSAGPPQPSGGGPLSSIPRPVLIGGIGVAVVVGYLWWHGRNASSATNTDTISPSVAPNIDPSTGGLIDPQTGLPYLTSQGSAASSTVTLQGWAAAAAAALKGAGYAPALIEQALYDFTNGNPLTNAEGGVIDKALGLVGQPPNLLPFFGTIPNPPGTPPKPTTTPSKGYTWTLVNNVWRQVRYAGQDPAKPKAAPKKGYVWDLVNGVWRQVRFAAQGPVPLSPAPVLTKKVS